MIEPGAEEFPLVHAGLEFRWVRQPTRSSELPVIEQSVREVVGHAVHLPGPVVRGAQEEHGLPLRRRDGGEPAHQALRDAREMSALDTAQSDAEGEYRRVDPPLRG